MAGRSDAGFGLGLGRGVLEAEYTKHHLAELIQTGGVAGGPVLPPATTSEISAT